MPDKGEKERRKKIMEELTKNSISEFEASLPTSREIFKNLFDYLEDELTKYDCDSRLTLTRKFLSNNKIINIDAILNWLLENGGGCDCEVLANIEDLFEY
jgi:type IV secretory pathway VirB9-like protein